VMDQYEESPYPRWVNVGLVEQSMTIEEVVVAAGLRVCQYEKSLSEPKQILIAGCGTGQHSLEAATRYDNSCVTAIDLSLSSLSFAIRRTKELGVDNINYFHGDILNVRLLERQFDVIEAVGVLHHMKDPILGWNTLKNSLKTGGLMRIGLYSEFARRDLQIIKEKIGNPSLPVTHQNICDYRKEILISNDPDLNRATRYSDFYSTSELRDLLFHVQEQNFTILEIKNILAELNLHFCGFESVDDETKSMISNGNGHFDDLYSLDAWHNFEISNPDYFSGMYSFWVQKID
jgi:SAM-dependent methyltransferase